MSAERFRTFEDFWTHYVLQHRKPLTRWLHLAGLGSAVAITAHALLKRRFRRLWLAPLAGYGLSWVGHFAIERNRPATFRHPLWSLRGDFRMVRMMLAGTMDAEVARVVAAGTPTPATDGDRVDDRPESEPAPDPRDFN